MKHHYDYPREKEKKKVQIDIRECKIRRSKFVHANQKYKSIVESRL